MDSIKVQFRTNLDLIHADKHQWPDRLPFRPQVGDLIRSHYVHPGRLCYEELGAEPRLVGKGFQLELEVNRVTLVTENEASWDTAILKYLDVELHLPKGRWESLKQFYDFYEKVTGSKFI